MSLELLAKTIAYILGDAGPYSGLDHTDITIEFDAYWYRFDEDHVLSYCGPTHVFVNMVSA